MTDKAKQFIEESKKNMMELAEKIKSAKMEMSKKSKYFIEEIVSEFLEKYPEVENVFWTQYTPYFNDGEPCEFSVNDIGFSFYGWEEDEEYDEYSGSFIYTEKDLSNALDTLSEILEYEKDPISWVETKTVEYIRKYGRQPWSKIGPPYPGTSEKQAICVNKIESFLDKFGREKVENLNNDFSEIVKNINLIDDDIMQIIYGDHVKVVITKNKTDIDEYDHD